MANLRSKQYPATVITASTTAPATPTVGQRWYKPETAVTYQYTSDGATSFWLDVTSDGIGTSATKSIDWAGNTDPLKNHSATLSGLAVGDVYYNREGNRYFVCQDATSLKNRWAGRYVGLGGIQQTYISGTTTYVSHTFHETGTFYLDATQSCDVLIVAGGGGGGGAGNDDTCGGGGGAGGVRELTAQSVAAGAHAIVVGMGGNGGFTLNSYHDENGENSSFTATYVAIGGGRAGTWSGGAGSAGGSGGGAGNGSDYNSPGADNDSNSFGSAGGNGSGTTNSGSSAAGGGGGGASTTAGTNATATAGGAGAAGRSNTWKTGAASIYGGGGGGAGISTRGQGGTGGGGLGSYGASSNTAENGGNGEPFTGGGGGGATSRGNALNRNNGYTSNSTGGNGGSGIVVIRYAVN